MTIKLFDCQVRYPGNVFTRLNIRVFVSSTFLIRAEYVAQYSYPYYKIDSTVDLNRRIFVDDLIREQQTLVSEFKTPQALAMRVLMSRPSR